MPPQQLSRILIAQRGANWRMRLTTFEPRPIAATSIAQVHRATLPSGLRGIGFVSGSQTGIYPPATAPAAPVEHR